MRTARVGLAIAAALLIAAVVLLAGAAKLTASNNRVERGTASTYGLGYDGWLALPEGRGHRVRICSKASGATRCATRTSNDAGPALFMQRRGRIADLDIQTFELLCDCQWHKVGLIKVSVEYLGTQASGTVQSRPTLPPTDTETGLERKWHLSHRGRK